MLHLLGHQLAHIVNLKRRLMDHQLHPTGITRSQRQILLMLHLSGDCTQKHLLGQLDMDPGQMARTLEGLEKEGYVTRHPWQVNRRCLMVQMTDKCRQELLPALLAAVDHVDQQVFKGFDQNDLNQIKVMLERMLENVQATDGDRPHES